MYYYEGIGEISSSSNSKEEVRNKNYDTTDDEDVPTALLRHCCC